MPERLLEEPPRAGRRDRPVELVRKADEASVGADESQLVVGPPGRVVEGGAEVREEPAAGQRAVREISCGTERRQRLDERDARYLVVVDAERPVGAALFEEPRERPIDGLEVRVEEDAIGHR